MEMSNYNSGIDVSPSSRGENKERHVCADYGAIVITVPKKATFFVLVEILSYIVSRQVRPHGVTDAYAVIRSIRVRELF